MMKNMLLFIVCATSVAVFAQQTPDIRPQRPTGERPQRNTDGQSSGAPAAFGSGAEFPSNQFGGIPDGTERPQGPASSIEQRDVPTANQESYEDIMGSFSDLAMKFSQEDTRNIEMFVYECKYIGGEAFSQALEPFLSVNGEISETQDADLVIISEEHENIEKLKLIAESIDRPIRQVLVSASIVEFQISEGFEKDISLQYNQFIDMEQVTPESGALDASFATRMLDAILPSGGNPASLSGSSSYIYYEPDEQTIFSAFLTFLETKGTARILSSPSLIMRRGYTGNILSGEDIPITESNVGSGGTSFSVEYKSVGIKLRVMPQSIFDDRVVLEVSPEVSNIIRYEESSAGRNPVIAIRSASTLLEMRDGQMVSIGGLLREEKIETEKRVPVLSSIPILGTLFRATNSEEIRSQLVIFLTANVVAPEDLSSSSITPGNVSDELQEKIDSSDAALQEMKHSFFEDLRRFFDE